MISIKVPGYKSIIPNTVFGKDDGSSTEILHLVRYRVPTRGEVVEGVVKKFRSGFREESIPRLSEKLEKGVIDGIRKVTERDSSQIRLLGDCFYQGTLSPGKSYIQAITGTIPNPFLESEKEILDKTGAPAYQSLLEGLKQIGLEPLSLTIGYEKQGLLPKTKIDRLLNNGILRSKELILREYSGDHNDIETLVDLLYQVFDSPKKISSLENVFNDALDGRIIRMVDSWAKKQKNVEYYSKNQIILSQIFGTHPFSDN